MGHIFVSWLHPFKEHRFVIIGSEGMIHFDDSKENLNTFMSLAKKYPDVDFEAYLVKNNGNVSGFKI